MTNQPHRILLALAVATVLALVGCAAAPQATEQTSGTTEQNTATGEPTVAPEEPTGAAEQAASCEWDIEQITAAPTPPEGSVGDLTTVLIGSWQHTHYDSGDGFEAVDHDIRYVFPAADQIIYCQHVPGATDHAEQSATITLDGTDLVLPAGPGFRVLAWNDDSMLWLNNVDDSTYLLVRR